MSTLVTLAVIGLAIDSVVVLYAVYKQRWLMLAIGVAIGAVLDYIIFTS